MNAASIHKSVPRILNISFQLIIALASDKELLNTADIGPVTENDNIIARLDLGLAIDQCAFAVTNQSAQFGFAWEIQFPHFLAGDT